MSKNTNSFRVGRVSVYRRGRVWYLCYHQDGHRYRSRVGPDRKGARPLAAQVNAQLEVSAPTVLAFEPISIPDLREQWLSHREHEVRLSLATVRRDRAASDHLIRFVRDVRPIRLASQFCARHAEAFVIHLRQQVVAPNGHPNAHRRPLRDKGIKFILETCRALFSYAEKRRYLSPHAENPFTAVGIDRIPVEDVKPFVGLTDDQERRFLEHCDDWQFPVFLTLLLTGLRPGELTHLLLPDDVDLDGRWLYVRNKPELGWQVKTRNERRIPLLPELTAVLRRQIGQRSTGTVFTRRRFWTGDPVPLAALSRTALNKELARRVDDAGVRRGAPPDRAERLRVASTVWRDLGTVKTDRLRMEFMRLTKAIGATEVTAPKTLRHMFATALQNMNVDPLVRNELMGHAPAGSGGGSGMTVMYVSGSERTFLVLAGRVSIVIAHPTDDLAQDRSCRGPVLRMRR